MWRGNELSSGGSHQQTTRAASTWTGIKGSQGVARGYGVWACTGVIFEDLGLKRGKREGFDRGGVVELR